MDLIAVIEARRSVRRFAEKTVEEEKIEGIGRSR